MLGHSVSSALLGRQQTACDNAVFERMRHHVKESFHAADHGHGYDESTMNDLVVGSSTACVYTYAYMDARASPVAIHVCDFEGTETRSFSPVQPVAVSSTISFHQGAESAGGMYVGRRTIRLAVAVDTAPAPSQKTRTPSDDGRFGRPRASRACVRRRRRHGRLLQSACA
ncbi:uncharacterized protein PV09_07141 [Verruconis gallopava]|uniref:Uncharacterized protein n=1 Tax=Verruconis gallopava TaxID=253628 RepID=A0A0D2A3H3_9PEZI|nr:uncharacterized protein PV09_07141 [Verruconis gallopava]KIW01373.1 hypothetical protein PV09_07141 [Verruconis gallopava]